MPSRSIAIFHAGALGDFVVTWFAALGLRRLFPDHEITYITHSSKGQLGRRFLDTAAAGIDVGGWHTLFSDEPRLLVPARELLDRCDAILCFVADSESRFAANLRMLLPGKSVLFIEPLPPPTFDRHITAWYLEQLAQALPEAPFDESLHQLATRGLGVARSGGGRVLLHPGSGAPQKCWPLECYAELAERFIGEGADVAMLLGEAELERLPERMVQGLKREYTVVCPGDFVTLAEELLNARLLITNDNGPGHLAGVLGIDVLSLFGPSNPRLWRPVGPRARVLRAEHLAALPVAKVLEAIAAPAGVPPAL